jgi:cysteine desulfurase / selenocysteine lyase
MWQEIRALFPIHKTCVYLNNAGVAPPSVRVTDALRSYHECHALHGVAELFRRYGDTGRRIKEILAGLLDCPASTLAITHNTSEGMNIVAQGLDWVPGDTVLGLDKEYPANVYPWWNLESKGVRYLQVPVFDLSDAFHRIEEAMDPSVRLVSVSGVNWCTGQVLDLARLGALCARKGIRLVVDMAQSLGIVSHPPDATGASAMAGSAWKWLMGPMGLGIFYCRPDLMACLRPVFVGTDTVVDARNYLDYRFLPRPDASRFEFSTPNFNDWVYLLASLELLREIGFQKVRDRIVALNDALRQALVEKGYRVLGAPSAGARSGITSFQRKGVDAGDTVARLAAHRIFVAERNGAIRVSPHIYNSEEDLEKLLEHL